MPSIQSLTEAERQTRLALQGISILRQIGERLRLPADTGILEELRALARAQRRVLKAALRQLEADPLLAHLLKSRAEYRIKDESRTKSGKRLEEFVRNSFYIASSLGFRGGIDDWRSLLAIFPQ